MNKLLYLKYFFVLLLIPQLSSALDYMPLSQIRSGMKGYGLTVFQGTEPEKFNIEIISVIKNRLPKQNMILIKCSGEKIEKTNVASGMSGSPIYIENKLIGALAYGWSFNREPVAGVTPIENILSDYSNPISESSHSGTDSKKKDIHKNMAKLKTPLLLNGISDNSIYMLNDFFEENKFIPVQSSGSGNWDANSDYKPGSALAIELISGDWQVSAVGTVTAISDSGHILAFGHPMFNWGKVSFPSSTAGIHTIISSSQLSWKMGGAVKTRGSLVQDRQSTIVIDPETKSETVKFKLNIISDDKTDSYSLNLAHNRYLTPQLALFSIVNALDVSGNYSGLKKTYFQNLKVTLSDGNILTYKNAEYSDAGKQIDFYYFEVLNYILNNPYKSITIKELEYDCRIISGNFHYKISDVICSVSEITEGDTFNFKVILKNSEGKSITKELPVKLNDINNSLNSINLTIASGNETPYYRQKHFNSKTYMENAVQEFSNSELTVSAYTGKKIVYYDSHKYLNPPDFFYETVFTDRDKYNETPEYRYFRYINNFIVSGIKNIILKIKK